MVGGGGRYAVSIIKTACGVVFGLSICASLFIFYVGAMVSAKNGPFPDVYLFTSIVIAVLSAIGFTLIAIGSGIAESNRLASQNLKTNVAIHNLLNARLKEDDRLYVEKSPSSTKEPPRRQLIQKTYSNGDEYVDGILG